MTIKPDRSGDEGLSETDIPADLVIDTRQPQAVPSSEESLAFHAARLLFLLKYAGGKNDRIEGRTRIAKLDFFVRYPVYLQKAAMKEGIPTDIDPGIRAESRMIRYRYGPWDDRYYNVFALLVARGLVSIYPSKKGDVFELTERGRHALEEMEGPDFAEVVQRCKLVHALFGKKSGTQIKDYIYENFPEVVALSIGKEIGK
jgi:hypothetical protein